MPRSSEAVAPVMETEASKTRSFAIAFVVDAEHLRQLQNVLKEIGSSLEYQVKLSDGHTLQFHNIEEVLKQTNSRTRSIVSLFAGVTGRGKQSASMVLKSLGDDGFGPPSVEYTVNGRHSKVSLWGDKLEDWIAGIRQWHSIFFRGVFALPLLGVVIGGPPSLWKTASPQLFSQAFLKSHIWVQPICILSLWVVIYWLFRLFPRATFAIGQGAKRHQFLTYIRTGIFVAFGLSVLASLLANWFTRRP